MFDCIVLKTTVGHKRGKVTS